MDNSSNLNWNMQVNRVAVSANKSLRFIRCNVKTKTPQNPRNGIQYSCSCPAGVYSAMWDPRTKEQTDKLDMVQRRAAQLEQDN